MSTIKSWKSSRIHKAGARSEVWAASGIKPMTQKKFFVFSKGISPSPESSPVKGEGVCEDHLVDAVRHGSWL
jgi:hypothetical protein